VIALALWLCAVADGAVVEPLWACGGGVCPAMCSNAIEGWLPPRAKLSTRPSAGPAGGRQSSDPTPCSANVLLTADAGTGRLSLTGFDLSPRHQTSLAGRRWKPAAPSHPALRLVGEIVSAALARKARITLSCEEGQEQVETSPSLSGRATRCGAYRPIKDFSRSAVAADRRPDPPQRGCAG